MPTIRLKVQVSPATDVLPRVIGICRRRQLDLLSLHYEGEEIEVVLAGDARCTRPLGRWLGALVDVRDVTELDVAPALCGAASNGRRTGQVRHGRGR
jgi:acetolactate synthase regulatory subunit